MRHQVQQLIVEVLKSRGSLRDFRAYLNAFGGARSAQGHTVNPSPPRVASGPVSLNALSEPTSLSLSMDATNTMDRVSDVVPLLSETHTALVKVQGPFTDRQLFSIAEGLVYLQTLGLVSAVVLDHDAWPRSMPFSRDGRRIDMDAEELAPWIPHGSSTAERLGLAEVGLRRSMVNELWRFSQMLSAAGADPRPQPHAVMRNASLEELPPHAFDSAIADDAVQHRVPLVSDASLSGVYSALAQGHIPVVAPLALYEEPGGLGGLRCICVDADDMMVALAREMANANVPGADLMPLRLMVINREGGIPSHARGGNPHLSINLASEYSSIKSSFVWSRTHPTALQNLDMIRDCLAYMPRTSSSVMVTHRSPKSLIANLITNIAAHSPSLPQRLLAGRKDVRHTPTVIRAGLPVRVVSRWEDVDTEKLQAVLETSFKRRLDRNAYYARLQRSLDFIIVTGDYDGVAIVTREYAPGDPVDAEPIAYLDKFAVLPKLQGSGAVDFLWGALRDEVHGLGLLDALNDNGGRGGFGTGRDLLWKSRAANPVNRWYFERSNGFVRLALEDYHHAASQRAPVTPDWLLFWCDAEDRLAHLAGESVFSPEPRSIDDARAAVEDHRVPEALLAPSLPSATVLPVIAPGEDGRLERWARCLAELPSAWAD